ncbi:MAG TPA: twin-arginine translocase TatA/TatE family subunit [Agrococcus sp.]|nr:twin-arginine translocase TatA/TatE family subunit [Agrococcus sp.]
MPLGNAFNGWHLLIILIVVLLVWGSTKLPALAESLGKSAKILKKEMRSDDAGKDERRSTSDSGSDSTSDQR